MDELQEWATQFCPEMNEGCHEPRAFGILPQVSPMQGEVELLVKCRRCGQRGLATLGLTYADVVNYDPTDRAREVEVSKMLADHWSPKSKPIDLVAVYGLSRIQQEELTERCEAPRRSPDATQES